MKLVVMEKFVGPRATIPCRVEWCCSQGVWFSIPDPDSFSRDCFEQFGFAFPHSVSFDELYICPWESNTSPRYYVVVERED